MKKENFKKVFTKRNILIIANAVFFILTCLACAVSILAVSAGEFEILLFIFSYISSQITFTALSLIVYYISIMAGALDKKYKEEVKDNSET